MQNDTWDVVKRSMNKKIFTNKWVFKLKKHQDGSIDKYKARLVVRGHEQKEGIDYNEVFAPVARYETIRTLLAAAVETEMHVHQMDVITAYVQGDLTEEIYMERPELVTTIQEDNAVCRLRKPLYGLKQAGRAWYKKLDTFLSQIGMKKTDADPCVYVNTGQSDRVIIIVYVDDLIIASRNLEMISNTKKELKRNFKMKDLGPINNILGINVKRKHPTGSITITQRKYIFNLLQKFNMSDCKEIATPLEISTKSTTCIIQNEKDKEDNMQHIPYRELVGGLIYLANTTRPDLAFTVSYLSRFCTNPNMTHWKLAKRVLRYLKGTMDYGITYTKQIKNSKLTLTQIGQAM